MGKSARAAARRALGAGAILSVEQAVQLLPWDDGFSRAWLRRAGLVSVLSLDGVTKECVVWAAVIASAWPTTIADPTIDDETSLAAPLLRRVPTKGRR